MLWNICAILEDELMRAKVGWEMLWVHALDRFIGEYAKTQAWLFPYASDKILYARYSLKQQRQVWSGLVGVKSMARNPYGWLVAVGKNALVAAVRRYTLGLSRSSTWIIYSVDLPYIVQRT